MPPSAALPASPNPLSSSVTSDDPPFFVGFLVFLFSHLGFPAFMGLPVFLVGVIGLRFVLLVPLKKKRGLSLGGAHAVVAP